MFFNKRKVIKQKIVRFSDVDSIVIETEGRHFQLLPKRKVVKYRNVISPRDGGVEFPDGYFCEKEVSIPQETTNLISTVFDQMFSSRIPENQLLPLPPGAICDASMRISFLGNTVYYTNTHTTNDGFVKKEPVAEEFKEIIKLLNQYCSFPKFADKNPPVKQSSKFTNKINLEVESNKSNRFIGYRFEATGIFGYQFYKAGDNFCSVTSIVAPSAPVMIYSKDIKWRSDYELCTIFPGLTRYIIDELSDQQVIQIIYKDTGEYEINGMIQVYCDSKKYTFYREDEIIAKIKKINNKEEHLQRIPNSYDNCEPYFEILVDVGISTELLPVILAFPMLRFAL
ncbi:MAG: hypothetical protein VZQ55_05685 [Ruminococcus sp.]|nr:hypothetical protein [Ruminococcus sp.]